jgi:hypothetical protein
VLAALTRAIIVTMPQLPVFFLPVKIGVGRSFRCGDLKVKLNGKG